MEIWILFALIAMLATTISIIAHKYISLYTTNSNHLVILTTFLFLVLYSLIYIIYNNKVKPCINRNKVSWYFLKILDEVKMQDAAKKLIGINDFSCFRSAHCQSNTPIRKINDIVITRENNYIYIDINANSFLYNMVRNLVGSLVLIGSGEKDIHWIEDLLISKDRNQGGKQFPASGLYLVNIEYESKYGLRNDIYYPKYN